MKRWREGQRKWMESTKYNICIILEEGKKEVNKYVRRRERRKKGRKALRKKQGRKL